MFISFEGSDGCGKSTQQRRLAEYLQTRNYETVCCRDPGSTALGDAVRNILLHGKEMRIGDRTEMFLFMAARTQLVEEVVRPALNAGKAVISDRFLMSSFVYQGFAGGVPIESLEVTGRIATDGILPDLSVILDIPYEIAVKRLGNRAEPDRMERKAEAYHRRVRDGFLHFAAENPQRCVVINAESSPDEVAAAVQQAVRRHFGIR